MVSGRYFLPKAPLLCLKRMPASGVTSVNSIAPEGRGGVGLGDGDATAAAVSVAGAAGATVAGCLQAPKSAAKSKKPKTPSAKPLRLCGEFICGSLFTA